MMFFGSALNRAGLLIVALTVLSVATNLTSAKHGASGSDWIRLGTSLIIFGGAWLKAMLVLDHFLELRTASKTWRNGFAFALAVLCGILGLLPPLLSFL